ncbi:Cathepsin B-like cysteine proteinase [Schistosoma japonicum]|nr:Cathepsin B-like cysteine proteinase [Schistosoma japonicum]
MLKIAVYIVSLFTLLEAHVTTRNNERIEPLSDEMISFINKHAVSAVGAMSDRICIQSGGKQSVELSAVDLISCCKYCGSGCDGGFLGPSWDYWVLRGIVTGGSKENHTGCRPYPFPKCDHFVKGKYRACGDKLYKTPQCNQTCQKGYNTSYEQDKHYGGFSYNVLSVESVIQKDIMMHGPVEAYLEIYEDFLNYKSGIYRYTTGQFISGHAVRLIGWGVENGTAYWLAANTWNEDWGEKGYFRIVRGRNECLIESEIAAGLIKS